MCLTLLPWTCLHGHVPLLSLLSRGKRRIVGLRWVPRKHLGTWSAMLLSGVKIYHVLRSSLSSLIIESRQIHPCAGTASSSRPHSSVLSIINKTALLARHWLLFSVQGLGEESQHNIPLSLSHPLALCCSRGITCSAGPFYVSTLLLFSQQKEHLHRMPSPSLLLSASCASQAVPSAQPPQGARSCPDPSCAASAALGWIWPPPPVAVPHAVCLVMIRIVLMFTCSVQRPGSSSLSFCGFVGALPVLIACLGKTREREKFWDMCYLTEGNIGIRLINLFLSSCNNQAACKDLLQYSS